ncbi:MAG: homocysteine S-methyltransferase family protein, partial [Synergistaceae bacterium]|nr:homocysteine S-methyltransferase family protein [Synergistaceae bacterium]
MFSSERILFFDGGMGSMLQARGLKLRELPEVLNLTNPDLIREIHNEYKAAGADFITSNTFGANRFKLAKSGYSVSEIVEAGTRIAREAA